MWYLLKDFGVYFYSLMIASDVNEVKEKLHQHSVSASILHNPALTWYSFSKPLKITIWGCATIIPLILSGIFVAPLIAVFLIIPSLTILTFLEYEVSRIKNALAHIETSDQINEQLTTRAEEEQELIHTLDDILETETNHELANCEAWDIEQGGEVLRNTVLETPAGPKSETIVRVSERLNEKADNLITTVTESNKATETFLAELSTIKAAYEPRLQKKSDAQQPKKNKVDLVNDATKKNITPPSALTANTILVKNNPTLNQTLVTQGAQAPTVNAGDFKWTFHVRSLSDLENFCKDNLTKLLFLFQKIEQKGLKIICKIETPVVKDGSIKTIESDFCNAVSKTTSNEDEQQALDIQSLDSSKANSWRLSFNIISKKSVSTLECGHAPKSRNAILQADSIGLDSNGQTSVLSLILKDIPRIANPAIHQSIQIDESSDDESLDESSDDESLPEDCDDKSISELLSVFSSILESKPLPETSSARSVRLAEEEADFQSKMASLGFL